MFDNQVMADYPFKKIYDMMLDLLKKFDKLFKSFWSVSYTFEN